MALPRGCRRRGVDARSLADRVGLAGHVVAIDVDLRFLSWNGLSDRSSLEVRRADVLTDEFESAAFDLVLTRHLLAHLGSRSSQAIDRMVAALRPGGWLVVEDIDLSGILMVTTDPALQVAADIVLKAVRRVIVDRGGDPRIGLRLPGLLEDAGLADVTIDARLHSCAATADSQCSHSPRGEHSVRNSSLMVLLAPSSTPCSKHSPNPATGHLTRPRSRGAAADRPGTRREPGQGPSPLGIAFCG